MLESFAGYPDYGFPATSIRSANAPNFAESSASCRYGYHEPRLIFGPRICFPGKSSHRRNSLSPLDEHHRPQSRNVRTGAGYLKRPMSSSRISRLMAIVNQCLAPTIRCVFLGNTCRWRQRAQSAVHIKSVPCNWIPRNEAGQAITRVSESNRTSFLQPRL